MVFGIDAETRPQLIASTTPNQKHVVLITRSLYKISVDKRRHQSEAQSLVELSCQNRLVNVAQAMREVIRGILL